MYSKERQYIKFKPNPLLYGANEDFFSTFRLAIRMKDTVDYDLLSRSVEKAMARYPYFCVFPKREEEDAFIEELRSLQIPVNRAGEERYTLCNTELIL